ncbi:DUF1573 domain-containing protein [Deminuibacter soli]|uniref:DUF1573 domain-containing protein n=1 Tax=Deminuibacter soli TaxID=2291815 RepID=A0A3E1NKL3_9BACT|nr:DUF1573 domain-containing protein [Deminuibacter soli]RFM28466.1 DUF1573 domain-containing protein [Deminuibacter soli]
MKRIFATAIVIACLVACRDRHNPYENKLNLRPSYLAQVDVEHYTTIQWYDTVQNFGTLKEGDSVRVKFRFKNTGKRPLFLSNIRSSCGCTVPSFPEKPIFSGEEDTLVATFNSEGHPGAARKGITITSNTNNGTVHVLYLVGNVIPRPTAPAIPKP